MNEIVRNSLASKKFWLVELIFLLLYGTGLGYECQRLADSGEFIFDKILVISAAGFVSFLVGAVVALLWRKWKPGHLYWVSAPILGSLLFSLLFGVVWFVYNSIGYRTVSEILSENAGFFTSRIVLQSVFFSIPIMVFLALPRIILIMWRLKAPK